MTTKDLLVLNNIRFKTRFKILKAADYKLEKNQRAVGYSSTLRGESRYTPKLPLNELDEITAEVFLNKNSMLGINK